uniref:U-scoloptoxin(23)-Er2a n=1 Tax=Ethmostigmus rubripes TaxID=62613 RepID=TXN2A_ETHRU|nr:RecName: Full=U-scoloptoxin(23)-Er2a; Short=U-SLPTX(23)-Er2a; Flags: Precursor [Ethmostigmus rubripes]
MSLIVVRTHSFILFWFSCCWRVCFIQWIRKYSIPMADMGRRDSASALLDASENKNHLWG